MRRGSLPRGSREPSKPRGVVVAVCCQCGTGALRKREELAEELQALGMRACGALAADRRAGALLTANKWSEEHREHARRIDSAVAAIAYRGPSLLEWSLELGGWCRPCAARAAARHDARAADGTPRLATGSVEDRPDTFDAATTTPPATLCRRCGDTLTEGRFATAQEIDSHSCARPAPRATEATAPADGGADATA